MNFLINTIMKNVLVTKAPSHSFWRRCLLLIPLLLVWFARSENANAQVDMARVLMNNQAINNDLQYGRAQQYANEARLRAAYSARAPAYSNLPQPYRPPMYQPQLYQSAPAIQQFPITATDFKPTKGRLLPAKIVNSTPGLTPEFREAAIARNNQSLDNFERVGRKNNLANSYAYLACVSLEVLNGQPVSNSDTQVLVSAFNNVLANNPGFAAVAPKTKQLLYETNIMSGGLIAYLHREGTREKNAQVEQEAKRQARAALKLLGIDKR